MNKILILGAYGKTAQLVIERLLAETDLQLHLFLRQANRLSKYEQNERVTLIEGDVKNTDQLITAMNDIDLVYSNVGGTDLFDATKSILKAMTVAKVKRLIFYSALGAYHEVPGKFGAFNETAIADFLPGFRQSAQLIDQQQTIITTQLRPAWLTDKAEIDYELTQRDESFKGTEVSRASVADVIVKIIKDPTQYQQASLGINKPGTDGDKPSWL